MKLFYILLIVLVSSIISTVATIVFYEKYDEIKSKVDLRNRGNNTDSLYSVSGVPDGLNFINAARSATPAVVHIKILQELKNVPNNPYEEMLRDFFGEDFNLPQEQFPIRQASGSGVIISSDGFIVTNNHVITDASRIEVVLSDKRSYVGKLIGTDPDTDLALIKINEKKLPYIKFGKSENLRVGSWVLAVGNPFNLNSTVTAGIISAQGRSINILRSEHNSAIESFIQTDAVVNPGNSGGALVNLQGELIGINTAIASPTGAFAGYAFAVPETIVRKVVGDLKDYGIVQRGFLGVMILDINAAVAKEKGIKNIEGVYILSVNKGSAAQKAGLREGDIIIKIDGRVINSAARLQEILGTYKPGDKVKITYSRRDKEQEADAVLQNQKGGTTLVGK